MSQPLPRFWFSVIVSVVIIGGMIVCATPLVPLEWRVDGSAWAVIIPLAYVDSSPLEIYTANPIWFSVVTGCHILFPVSLHIA